MAIHFYSDPEEVNVEFCGGDLIVGLCGGDDGVITSIGIADAPRIGTPNEELDEEDEATPTVFLSFQTEVSLDTFILRLEEYRAERFGRRP